MLLPLRFLLYTSTTPAAAPAETRGGVSKRGIRRPRHVHWDDNVVLPSQRDLALHALNAQIAEEDEILALMATLM